MDTEILQDQPPEGIEVAMVDPEIVRQIRAFASLGWGSRRIAGELGIARKTVRRYVRGRAAAEVQTRPTARVLSEALRAEAVPLFVAVLGYSRREYVQAFLSQRHDDWRG